MFLDDLVGLRIVIVRDWRDVPIRWIPTQGQAKIVGLDSIVPLSVTGLGDFTTGKAKFVNFQVLDRLWPFL